MGATQAFGVPPLDALLAPVPRGAAVALVNDPGVEAEPFLYQAAAGHLASGASVVYLVTSRSPSSVARAAREFGFDLGGDRLAFADAFSPLMGGSEGARYEIPDARELAGVADALERAADDQPDAVLVVDSLSALVDLASPAAFVAAFPRLLRAMTRFRAAFALFTRWPYPEEATRALDAFDGVVTLRGVEERVMLSQYFAVTKAAWSARVDAKPRLYRALKPGGVFVYIPKIVVTGAYGAGKSTFVHAVSEAAVSVDRLGTTVALDHGRFTKDGLTADIFGTPGQTRFDPILKTVAGQALGVVVVVDSTKPESFQRARDMMQQTWRQGLPAIVAATKQDLPGALAPSEVQALLAPPAGVKVVGCVATDRDACRRVLGDLIDQILAAEVKA